jgi:hypothetical protein
MSSLFLLGEGSEAEQTTVEAFHAYLSRGLDLDVSGLPAFLFLFAIDAAKLRMHGTEIERPLAIDRRLGDFDRFHSAGLANDLSMVFATYGRRTCPVILNGARYESHGMGRDFRVSRSIILAASGRDVQD